MYVTNQKALIDAGRIVGSQAELARRLGVSPARMNYWVNRSGKVPYEYVLAIENITGGKITRHQLLDRFPRHVSEKNGDPDVPGEMLASERQVCFENEIRHALHLFKSEMVAEISAAMKKILNEFIKRR